MAEDISSTASNTIPFPTLTIVYLVTQAKDLIDEISQKYNNITVEDCNGFFSDGVKRDYKKIAEGRAFFGDFDPFGDFDLLFGAAKLGLKIVEVPVRYASRTYGETQISRFSDGFLLLWMVVFAWRKFKAL